MNPAFARTLKDLEVRLDTRLAEMRGILEESTDDVKAILDFIDVEKIKTRSNVQKSLEAEDLGSKDSLQNMVWLQHLQRFTNDFPLDGLLASATYLDQMIDRLETLFIEDQPVEQTKDELENSPIIPGIQAS